jgi:spermidine synthase
VSTVSPASGSLTTGNVSYDAPPLGRATSKTGATFAILGALYFASGAVGLVDEVIFFKYLSLGFGATAYASSAVLVAFMGGLALGAALAARFDRRIGRPLVAYGALEVAVGIACAASPWLFAGVTRAYVDAAAGLPSLTALSALRGALAGAVVLVPTVAMGATLPLVARVAGAAAGGERRVALLYGLNTAGGAAGLSSARTSSCPRSASRRACARARA